MTEQREEYDITVVPPGALLPAIGMEVAINRRNQMVQFVKQIMIPDTDYGTLPGTDKPTLKKPGAEKLLTFFGLTNKFNIEERIEDWDRPLFYYLVRCPLYRDGNLIAEAHGSCNSRESKYRYRQAERTCPKCSKPTIFKSKKDSGWFCWAKRGGCGATFKDGDRSIESQEAGRVENPDIADQVNTILKMAEKRALVAAVLIAVNASEFFTQDVEDMVETDYVEVAAPPAQQQPENGEGNGGNGQAPDPSRGQASNIPNEPKEFFNYVNAHVQVPYDAVAHLYNAIKQENGGTFSWPKPKDTAAWERAYDLAVQHANAKTQSDEAGQQMFEEAA